MAEEIGWLWWLALLIQLLSVPGALLPLLPGLIWLPVGAGIWWVAVGWTDAWPAVVLSLTIFTLGAIADFLALGLATARLEASRWAALGAAIGLLMGIVGLLPALPVGGPLVGALFGPWLGAAIAECIATRKPPGPTGWLGALRRGALVGLAVVAGLLVSRLAQVLLALAGVGGFVLLSLS